VHRKTWSQSKRKRCTDSKRLSDGQWKNRQGGKPRQGRLRKNEGEQRHHPGQEQEAEGEGLEGAEHLLQLPQLEAMLELVDRPEEASIAAGLQVVELAAASGEGCEEEVEA
jgi:hypothetical protein